MGLVPPDYLGRGLVNLVAELERRLLGQAPMPGLAQGNLPQADGYVLVVFDGLGAHQLAHPAATSLAASCTQVLTAGFPTTTTTSMATIVTGLPPARHGIIGHILHLPGIGDAVNVLKWVTPEGRPIEHPYASVLPSPNLWERLTDAGVIPVTVQPGAFMGSPLTRMLYRGCRFEAAWSVEELVQATLELARPGRLVMTYFPNVDVAAHVDGQDSEAYAQALGAAALVWDRLARSLPDSVGLVGTADHGHLDYAENDKILIRDKKFEPLRFFGDPRSVYVSGPTDLIEALAADTGATVHGVEQVLEWLGGPPTHPELDGRLPDRLLLAPEDRILLPKPFDKRLIGYHGGLAPAEMEIPLLVRR
ncbi:MAG TPA: alkaline phosphatase family protein [Acidimicrobiia bacterium]|nr:alkaline phosphatase family protein [Acidimicrobiia bacterium]